MAGIRYRTFPPGIQFAARDARLPDESYAGSKAAIIP